jgi:Spy/CpxP family protein refolding chaperone
MQTKTRSKTCALVAAVALGAVTAAGVAQARPGGGRCGGPGHAMLERLEQDLGGLGLAQAELDAAYAVIDRARKERRGLDGELRAAHERMHELLEQDAPDGGAVTAQADAIGALTTRLRKMELAAALEVRALLTPAQREALASRRDRMEKRGPPPL